MFERETAIWIENEPFKPKTERLKEKRAVWIENEPFKLKTECLNENGPFD